MKKIVCGARACMHNMSGRCDAGVVRIEEQIGLHTPYCATVTVSGDAENTVRNFFKQQYWRKDRLDGSGTLVCSMLRCVHNARGFCDADHVEILPPQPAESRFAPCGSFRKA